MPPWHWHVPARKYVLKKKQLSFNIVIDRSRSSGGARGRAWAFSKSENMYTHDETTWDWLTTLQNRFFYGLLFFQIWLGFFSEKCPHIQGFRKLDSKSTELPATL